MIPVTDLRPVNISLLPATSASESRPSHPLCRLPVSLPCYDISSFLSSLFSGVTVITVVLPFNVLGLHIPVYGYTTGFLRELFQCDFQRLFGLSSIRGRLRAERKPSLHLYSDCVNIRISVSDSWLLTKLWTCLNIFFSMVTCKSDRSGMMIVEATFSIICTIFLPAMRSNPFGPYSVRPGSPTRARRPAARPAADDLSSRYLY